jgi:curved DNA-binding protein CbpA
MKQTHSFEDCYRILNSNPESSWNELRKSYKTKIQKCHPDRYEDNSTEKNIAETQIKELNKAYQQLSRYYRKNGALPEIEKPEFRPKPQSKSESTRQKPTRTKPESTHFTEPGKSSYKKPPAQKEAKSSKTVILAGITMVFITYIAIDSSTEIKSIKSEPVNSRQSPNNKIMTQPVNADKQITLDSSNKPDSDKDKSEKITLKPFTYGSTIGDVISAQGTPTRTDGDIWYYGESKVHFDEGIVRNWERRLGSPLNASISKPLKDEAEKDKKVNHSPLN